MAKSRGGRSYILRDEFLARVEAEAKNIRIEVKNYDYKTLIISAFDSALNSTWGDPNAPVPLVLRDRFPSISGYTPDFLFAFDNGYHLVGEFKPAWRRDKLQAKDLNQLIAYVKFTFPPLPKSDLPPERAHDVLLIVSGATDEPACEAIAAEPELGEGSVVVTEAYHEGHMATSEFVRFAYRRHLNGRFAEPNAGPPDSSYDLNKWFVQGGGFDAKCDAKTLLEAGECPFVNDTPPETYTLVQVLLPILNRLLDEPGRDELAASNRVSLRFTMDQIMNLAEAQYRRVPKEKLRSWLAEAVRALVLLDIAVSVQREGVTHFEMQLDDRMQRLEEDRMVSKLARGRVALSYVPVRAVPETGQMEFDWDNA